MVRVKRGNIAKKRRLKILKTAKGFNGAHSQLFRTANGQVMKALIYSYFNRKRRKTEFRKLWICRLNSAARKKGLNYCFLKHSLLNASIIINLKVLSQLLEIDRKTFSCILEKIK